MKPRFGCAFDISVAPQGFNVAAELEAYLRHFISGGSCDRGFIPMRINELMPKSNIEFGFPTDREMPSLESMGVSVVFHVPGDVDVGLLATSLSSVVTMFPDVMEAVIVFLDLPTKGTMKLVKKRIKILMTSLARLPIEIVARRNGNRPIRIDLPEDSQSGAGGGIGYWSSLHADAYCKGDFVMLMEAGDLLVKEVTYDNIFHFGKPVLPFTRLSDEFEEGPGVIPLHGMTTCRVNVCLACKNSATEKRASNVWGDYAHAHELRICYFYIFSFLFTSAHISLMGPKMLWAVLAAFGQVQDPWPYKKAKFRLSRTILPAPFRKQCRLTCRRSYDNPLLV